MIRYVLSRLGCLILMVGILLLVLGVAAERSGQPAFNYLGLGIILFISGFFLWSKLRRKPRRNTRFSLFRKRERGEKDEQELEDHGWGDNYND